MLLIYALVDQFMQYIKLLFLHIQEFIRESGTLNAAGRHLGVELPDMQSFNVLSSPLLSVGRLSHQPPSIPSSGPHGIMCVCVLGICAL